MKDEDVTANAETGTSLEGLLLILSADATSAVKSIDEVQDTLTWAMVYKALRGLMMAFPGKIEEEDYCDE